MQARTIIYKYAIPLIGFLLSWINVFYDPALIPLFFIAVFAMYLTERIMINFRSPIASLDPMWQIFLVLVVPVFEEHLFRWWLPTLLDYMNFSSPLFVALVF